MRSPSFPFVARQEQQAATPLADRRSRYFHASGGDAKHSSPEFLEHLFGVIDAASAEDKAAIEAQQRIRDQTPPERLMAFLQQDKGPVILRKLIAKRLQTEASGVLVSGT